MKHFGFQLAAACMHKNPASYTCYHTKEHYVIDKAGPCMFITIPHEEGQRIQQKL